MEVHSAGSRAAEPGRGQTFHGEGILAITKALLQSGVAYVGGYQGAPVSHLLDVMVQAEAYLDELGVHVEACSNEASAAAMLGASIHYPLRGAVTWKSIVGTNVAADALVEPFLARRDRRRADRGRRGLRRRCERDPGAHARLRAQVDDADARPAARSCRTWCAWWKRAFALSEASNMPAHAGAAHPRLPRARQLRVQGQRRAGDLDARADGRAGPVRLRAAGASAGDVPPRETQGRGSAFRPRGATSSSTA